MGAAILPSLTNSSPSLATALLLARLVLTEILYYNPSSPHYCTEGREVCGGRDPSLINKQLSQTGNGVAACQTCIHLDDDCWPVFITLLHIRVVGDIVHIRPLRLLHCLDDTLVQGYLLISNGTSLLGTFQKINMFIILINLK